VLWNTIYMDASLNQLTSEGYEVRPEDVARLSPLGLKHINMLGDTPSRCRTLSREVSSDRCVTRAWLVSMRRDRGLV
jgi:Tn3 transposase DDE domain